jgi:transcriptional regulator with XRE-family HTH domain
VRKDAGLTGRGLAAATGWHFTRISKIENGVQSPTDHDIRTWCSACLAQDLYPDLIAQARAVESMYLEFKRQTRGGLKHLMNTPVPLYERTRQFRIYEHHVIPGLFQTKGYARAILQFWSSFLDTHDDIDEAITARMARQSVVYDSKKTFSIVLEQSALYTRFCEVDTLSDQLERVLYVMSLPNVSIGIVPMMKRREAIGQVSFWIFDDKSGQPRDANREHRSHHTARNRPNLERRQDHQHGTRRGGTARYSARKIRQRPLAMRRNTRRCGNGGNLEPRCSVRTARPRRGPGVTQNPR